jgi:hypothetical protein
MHRNFSADEELDAVQKGYFNLCSRRNAILEHMQSDNMFRPF